MISFDSAKLMLRSSSMAQKNKKKKIKEMNKQALMDASMSEL